MTKDNKSKLKLVDLDGLNCFFLEDDVTTYHTLYFKVENDEGFYAYSSDEKDVIELRNKLIKGRFFKPLELQVLKINNIQAIIKRKRDRVNV
jgi:hypothetical protein